MISSAYIEVLKDSFFSYFILTFKSELAFPALVKFGKEDPTIAACYAVTGSVLGLLLSFCIFYLLSLSLKKFLKCDFIAWQTF
jgi:membrane protein YqaA with SNARE-associated domain